MLKKLITLLVVGVILSPVFCSAQPEEKMHFGYGSVGTIGGYPTV